MKFRYLIRIVVIACIVLLCAGFGVYSYWRLSAADRGKDFNLYALVPQDAIAVLETDRMANLVEEVNQLACSKDNHFLYISELFVYLKKYLYLLVDDTPHGLSKQMNKMLISFHEPDNPVNQVLYCSLGEGDAALVENFVRKYCSNVFPSKEQEYKGEKILLYAMADGRTLAVYFTPEFLVASFQSRLVEQVIDAYQSKSSLMELASFKRMYASDPMNVSATIYMRMRSIEMGKKADELHSEARLGSWAEFDLQLNEDAIYCSGVSYGSDTTRTFMNALKQQQPVEGFFGEQLPMTTFFYTCWALSDRQAMFDFTSHMAYSQAVYSENVKQNDRRWMDYLDRCAQGRVLSCLFYPRQADSSCFPYAVLRIPLKNRAFAEQELKRLVENHSQIGKQVCSVQGKEYVLYQCANNTLLIQLTGITQTALSTYFCLYEDALLLAPDANSLSAYMQMMADKEVLAGSPGYEEGIGSLAPTYNYVMMVDVEEMLRQPAAYVRLIPNFFFRQSCFFRHFILSIQFTCTDGVVYPNLVLLYKGEVPY